MDGDLVYGTELAITGLLIGVMYSMVALGFVLIYKASAVFNFAQGAMTLFGALTVVGLSPLLGLPLALTGALVAMAVIAVAVERWVLRPLIGRSALTVFMATVGVAYALEGLAQLIWGNQPRGLKLDIPQAPLQLGGVYVSPPDLIGGAIAGVCVMLLVLFFQRTKIGLGLRAMADDPIAAQAMGVRVGRIWAVAWMLTGAVAIVAYLGALLVLTFRHQGLLGEKTIDRI